MEEIRRKAIEQEQLCHVLQILEKLEPLKTHFLDQDNLDYLGVAIGQPLDVDNDDSTWDFDTRFFQPWITDELIDECSWDVSWRGRLISEYSHSEWVYSDWMFGWFRSSIQGLYEMEKELWDPWIIDPTTIRRCTGLDLPFCIRILPGDSLSGRHYFPLAALFPVDTTKPHVACFMGDSNVAPGDEVLYSEVHFALQLLKWRLEQGKHTGHHTKPGILYTLQRDLFARITQVHFDGKSNKLVLRRSRRLDLQGGPDPPKDAYLLLRWVASRPVGQTEYVDEPEPEERAAKDSSNTAHRLLLGRAS